VEHAKNLAEEFKTAGIKSDMVHGGMSREDRDRIINEYRNGDIQVLTNCQVLTEGFDVPATSCVIVARPTKSRGLYQQMVGRGLRRHPGKGECVVIDFNDRVHTLCNSIILLPDAEIAEQLEREHRQKERQLREKIPDNLNRKLKAAYISSNLLGDVFNWRRLQKGYVLKGNDNIELWVVEREGGYRVGVCDEKGASVIANGLSFEYAFASAEDYARDHRSLFVLSDREAPWRDEPISPKQLEIFRSAGYRSGIEQMTKGQASDLISSGVLRRTG
jgi:superfamily II DNA or RNA helicase